MVKFPFILLHQNVATDIPGIDVEGVINAVNGSCM